MAVSSFLSSASFHEFCMRKAPKDMNKVTIEQNSDGSYNVTLPDGGHSPALSAQDVVKCLQYRTPTELFEPLVAIES